MSSPALNEQKAAPAKAWLLAVLVLALPAWLAACSTTARRPAPVPAPVVPAPGPPAIPDQVQDNFQRAVQLMRDGKTDQAALEFKLVAQEDPNLAAPYANIGILYRKEGQLAEAENALKTAVEHNPRSAAAWTELGATQRLRGEFQQAAASYEKAIAADPQYAPAYRNLGVVTDLYLGDPVRALAAFERYKALTGEDKPVSNWIAELRHRAAKAAQAPASAGAPQKVSVPAAAAARTN